MRTQPQLIEYTPEINAKMGFSSYERPESKGHFMVPSIKISYFLILFQIKNAFTKIRLHYFEVIRFIRS